MEKTFRRYQSKPSARHAFVEAEAVTAIAHQIRVLRTQRGWSQKELARRLGTTQAAVSRLEDAGYGRITSRTMLELGKVFDVAPVFKFVSTITLMRERWAVRRQDLEVPSFEEEAQHVVFVAAVSRDQVHGGKQPVATTFAGITKTVTLNMTSFVKSTSITSMAGTFEAPLPVAPQRASA